MTPRRHIPPVDRPEPAGTGETRDPLAQQKRAGPRPGSARHRRCAARFAAVQALYQAEMTGTNLGSLIKEYCEHRLTPEVAAQSSESLGPADRDTFTGAVLGAGRYRDRIDGAIRRRLKDGWTSDRLDPVLRASLRAAGGELAAGTGKPAEILRDYTDLARAFGGGAREIGFANALLEAIASDLAEPGPEPRE